MQNFEYASAIDSDVQSLFEYHANPGALNRLIPPWENITIQQRSDSLIVASEVILKNSLFGLPVTWRARHTELNPPESFQDIQLSGPFKTWIHDHHFQSDGTGRSTLQDRIRFEMKFGLIGTVASPMVLAKLKAMFAYRHRTTQADLCLQNFLKPFTSNRPLRIGVTGSTGMIGHRLVDLISVLGHRAVRILRPTSLDRAQDFPISATAVVWQPGRGFSDNATMQDLDAVIHLAGMGIASGRWTAASKQSIRASRIEGTKQLVGDLCNLGTPPKAFVCASGVGFYGDRSADILDESESAGGDFLAKLAVDWESAASGFERSGNRVVIGRLGIALHPRQGALSKLLLPFRIGLGGPIGSGRQYWSWIDIDDAAAGFLYLAANPKCIGVYNLVAPEQTDNRTFSKTLASVLFRPSLLPAPSFALRILLGEMADAMLLSSTRAHCKRLVDEGFPFRSPSLKDCLRHVLGYEFA
jgi:uncharacterized protein